jgi:anti-anti-sigma factor
MRAFGLTERTREPGCHEILIEGELDLSNADRLREALDRAASNPGNEQVLLSLERCEFIDSTGIAVIVQAHARMADQGRRLTVYGASSQVHRILTITGLTQDGLVFANADEARSAPE